MRFEFATSVSALLVADLHDLCYADKQKRERLLSNAKLADVEKKNRQHRGVFLEQNKLEYERLKADASRPEDDQKGDARKLRKSNAPTSRR